MGEYVLVLSGDLAAIETGGNAYHGARSESNTCAISLYLEEAISLQTNNHLQLLKTNCYRAMAVTEAFRVSRKGRLWRLMQQEIKRFLGL